MMPLLLLLLLLLPTDPASAPRSWRVSSRWRSSFPSGATVPLASALSAGGGSAAAGQTAAAEAECGEAEAMAEADDTEADAGHDVSVLQPSMV